MKERKELDPYLETSRLIQYLEDSEGVLIYYLLIYVIPDEASGEAQIQVQISWLRQILRTCSSGRTISALAFLMLGNPSRTSIGMGV